MKVVREYIDSRRTVMTVSDAPFLVTRKATGRNTLAGIADGVIETLAASEHALAREAAQLRQALHVATGMLRQRDLDNVKLRDANHRLRDEIRTLRDNKRERTQRAA